MKLTILTHDKTYYGGTDRLLSYCNEKNIDLNSNEVLYLPIDRKILVSKEEIEAYEVMSKLIDEKFNRKNIENMFSISDPFRWNAWRKEKVITSGYEQLLSIIFFILLNGNKKVLVIDHIEKNLHVLTTIYLIRVILNNFNFSDFIFTTYQESVLIKYIDLIKVE